MIVNLLTLLPDECRAYVNASILGRAQAAGLLEVSVCNIRDFAQDKHRTVDDVPYGGGDGMVMLAAPIMAALQSCQPTGPVIMLSPRGEVFNQAMAMEFSRLPRFTLLCGRYEGIDQRVIDLNVDREVSLGDFVLTGGELAALSIIDAAARLIPGVLGGENSAQEDSFSNGLLEYPHYTRPPEFAGLKVPEVLLSGHHAKIARFRREESLRVTAQRRPELLESADLSVEDKEFLKKILEN